MSYTSIIFLYFFLPSFIVLYAIVKTSWRPVLMAAGSSIVIAWATPFALIPMGIAVTLAYILGLIFGKMKEKKKAAGALLLLFLLIIIGQAVYFFAVHSSDDKLISAFGLGIMTLGSISYVIDVFRGDTADERNLFKVWAYICFLPSLCGIPFVRYEDIRSNLEKPQIRSDLMADGILLMLTGICEKIIVSDRLFELFNDMQTTASGGLSSITYWMGALVFGSAMYIKLKGLSHIGRGFGMMLGFEIPLSFDYPYSKSTVKEYIQSYNIPAYGFAKRYIYEPLTKNIKGKGFGIFASAIALIIICVSYHISLNYLLWGALASLLLMLELGFEKKLSSVPKVVKYILTHVLILIGWALISQNSIDASVDYIMHMFTGGMLIDSKPLLYFLGSALPYFLIILVFELPAMKKAVIKIREKRGSVLSAAKPFLIFALLILCTSYMMAGSIAANTAAR